MKIALAVSALVLFLTAGILAIARGSSAPRDGTSEFIVSVMTGDVSTDEEVVYTGQNRGWEGEWWGWFAQDESSSYITVAFPSIVGEVTAQIYKFERMKDSGYKRKTSQDWRIFFKTSDGVIYRIRGLGSAGTLETYYDRAGDYWYVEFIGAEWHQVIGGYEMTPIGTVSFRFTVTRQA